MLIIMVVKMLMMKTMDARQVVDDVSERVMRMETMIKKDGNWNNDDSDNKEDLSMMMRSMDCRQAGELMNI